VRRFFKVKNFFLISFLAVAGIFSATAIIKDKQVEDTPVVEKAEASNGYYFIGSESSWKTPRTFESITLGTTSYYKLTITVKAGDTFKITNGSNWLGYSDLVSGKSNYNGLASYFGDAGSDNNIKVNTGKGGEYTFLLHDSFDTYGDKYKAIYCFPGKPNQTIYIKTNEIFTGAKIYCYSGINQDYCLVKDGSTWPNWDGSHSMQDDEGYLYEITYPIPPQHVIFRSSNAQTADLDLSPGKYYNVSSVSGGTISGSWTNLTLRTITPYAKFFKGSHLVGTEQLSTDVVVSGSAYQRTWSTYDHGGLTYTWDKYYTNEACTTPYNNTAITSNTILYAKFYDAQNYTVSIRYVIDGARNSQLDYSINNISSGTDVSSLATPALYGYNFDGWFRNEACTTSASEDYVGSATTLYAKLTRHSSNKTYYVDVTSCKSKFSSLIYVHFFNKTGNVVNDSTTWPGVLLTGISGISDLYSFTIPSDCTGFIVGLNNGNNYQQTVDIEPSTEHNLYVITTNSSTEKQSGEWKDVIYYLEGDKTFTGDSSTAWKTSGGYVMHEPTTDNGNAAEVTGITVPNSSTVKIVMLYGDSGSFSDYWYGTLGASYTFCRNDGSSNIIFGDSAGGTYSFYLKNGKVYIENDANKTNYGYIYFSSDENASDIEITCQNSNGDTTLNNIRLSYVADEVSSLTLTFNNIKGLHKVSLYNLRGNNTTYPITSIIIYEKNNEVTTTVTFTDDATGPVYYIKTGLSANNKNANIAKEASVAFDIDRAVQSATNGSVCNIEKPVAIALCTAYKNLPSKTNIESATIATWASTVGDSGADIPMTSVRYQLGNIAGGSYKVSSLGNFGFNNIFGNDGDNVTTIIIIIASSVSLLSITALSVLLVKKRKAKQDGSVNLRGG